ncbi:MAG: hypothetical protein ACYTDW_00625 [Planctomycetota bacterium]|jgi:hypothetical protein
MKTFVKKVIIPAVIAAFIWFTMSEHGGFVNNLLNYVYDQNYYFVAAPDGPDYTVETTGQYWFVTGEYKPVANQTQAAAFQPQTWSLHEEDEGELLYLVLELTEEYGKDGPDAWAPEGNACAHEIVMVPEGAMHPTIALWLKPIECSCFIVNGGPYCGFKHEGIPGVDYRFTPKSFVTYKPDLTLTVFSNLR